MTPPPRARRSPRALPIAALAAVALLCSGYGPYRPAGAGALALGQADAVVATANGLTALYANPANMAQTKRQVFDAGFSRNPQAGTSSLSVGGVDGTSGWGITAGLGYAYDANWGVDAPQRGMHDVRFGLAAAVESDAGRVMIGAAGRYLTGGLYASGQHLEGFGTDLGIAAALSGLRAGLVLRNAVRVDVAETPRRVAAGVGWAADHVLVDADAAWGTDERSGQAYRAGIAVQPGEEGLQLRAGYAFDRTVPRDPLRHFVAGGLSWRTPRVALDLSAAVNVARPDETIIAVGIGMVLPPENE